jgi:hypothetical protein
LEELHEADRLLAVLPPTLHLILVGPAAADAFSQIRTRSGCPEMVKTSCPS